MVKNIPDGLIDICEKILGGDNFAINKTSNVDERIKVLTYCVALLSEQIRKEKNEAIKTNEPKRETKSGPNYR